MIRKALGPLEAQTFLQAQPREAEVEARVSRSPRHDTFRGAKVACLAPGAGAEEEESTSRACQAKEPLERMGPSRPVAQRLSRFVQRAAWPSSPANWFGGGWERRGCFKGALGV